MSEEIKNDNQEIKELLEKNLALSEKVAEDLVRVKNFIKWQNIWATIRLLIVVIPIIIGFIYLPPLIKEYLSNYFQFLNQ
jgi:hypothetical protein